MWSITGKRTVCVVCLCTSLEKKSSLNYCTNSVLSLMTIIFTLMPESPSGCGSSVLVKKEGEGKKRQTDLDTVYVSSGQIFNHEETLRVSLFPLELVGTVRGGGLRGFSQDARCQTGMSKQSHEPGVVLGYEDCGHADASQCSPFIEEKGSAKRGRASQPKLAAHLSGPFSSAGR